LSRQDSYLTPLPPLPFRTAEAGSSAGANVPVPGPSSRPRAARRPLGRRIVSGLAFASIAGLVVSAVAPMALLLGGSRGPAAGADAGAASLAAPGMSDGVGLVSPQQLVGSDAPGFSLGGTAAVEAVTPEASLEVPPETGLVDPTLLENSPVRYPFASKMSLTDGFGPRTVPVSGFHDAQDFAAPDGTPVLVIAGGIVLEAGWADDGCGFGLKVQHLVDDETLTSRYCHMQSDSHDYEVGDRVRFGDTAGRVGNTGMSFGAHLHLALRLEGEPIDPLPYIEANSS